MSYTAEQQEAIDEAWNLYNQAKDAREELGEFLDTLDDDIDASKASTAGYQAYSTLDEAFSTGEPILPPHSNDLDE